jgi:DMSO/TMAO reductase YedYZ molybdopterin-dependent catalytic subunit
MARAARVRRASAPAAALTALLALAGPASAQAAAPPGTADGAAAAPAVMLSGQIRLPRILTLADLQALPPVTVELPVAAAQGPRRISCTGALLWPLLQAAAPVDEPGRATQHRHTVLAQGRDGCAVAVAFGELDPHLEGKQVLIAYAQDGRPLPAPRLPATRLVVPGDSHAGRAVRDLVTVEIR